MALPYVRWDAAAGEFRAYEDNDSGLTAFQVKWDDTYNRFRILGNMLAPPGGVLGDNRKLAANWVNSQGHFSINYSPIFAFDASLNNLWASASSISSLDLIFTGGKLYSAGVDLATLDCGVYDIYDALGHRLFSKYKSGAGYGAGYGIEVDANGNVYVAGYVNDNKSVWKYDSAGVEQWSYYTGGNATGIEVDDAGNVYVTSARGTNGDGTFSVWKLNSSGAFVWGFDTGGTALEVKIDNSGDIIIGAITAGAGASAHQVYKLNSAGVEQWNADIDDSANGLAIDGSDNIYVAGGGASSKPVVKLNSGGVEQWNYDTGGTGQDIGLDSSGNVYVGDARGTNGDGTYTLWKLNSAGAFQAGFDTGYGLASLVIDNDIIYCGA